MRYIQNVLNKQNEEREEHEAKRRRFLEDMGTFFVGYGLAPSIGRMWGYLMLAEEPVSLDRIADDVGISKSGASTTARVLETWGMARRIHQPGSRRLLIEAAPATTLLADVGMAQVRRLVKTLADGEAVAPPGIAKARVSELAAFMRTYLELVREALGQLREASRS